MRMNDTHAAAVAAALAAMRELEVRIAAAQAEAQAARDAVTTAAAAISAESAIAQRLVEMRARQQSMFADYFDGSASRSDIVGMKGDIGATEAEAQTIRAQAAQARENHEALQAALDAANSRVGTLMGQRLAAESAFRREAAKQLLNERIDALERALDTFLVGHAATGFASELANPSPANIADRQPALTAGQVQDLVVPTIA